MNDIKKRYEFLKSSEAEKQKQLLREQREVDCFPYINRGQLWYDTLTSEQLTELNIWYQAWLDVTITLEIPTKPSWLE